MTSRFTFDREVIVRIFFFSTFALLLFQLFLLAKPFLTALLLSGILALTFYPFYRWIHRKTRRPNLSAFLVTLVVILLALIPLSLLVWLLLREASSLIPAVQNVLAEINSGDAALLREKLPPFLVQRLDYFSSHYDLDLQGLIMSNVRELVTGLSMYTALAAKNGFFIFFKLMLLVVSLFFFFRDGELFWQKLLALVPMEAHHKQAVARDAYETFRAVSVGVFLTAAAQGLTAMLGFFLAGIRMPMLLGFATIFVSLLGASFIVCMPVALFVMFSNFYKGLFLLLWGIIVVGWLDNLLKPILIGSRTRMPFILVFFSLLGGLKMYGLVGLIMGPVLVACVLTFIRIYREAYNR
jgi:predicted PurR-regulated permease PerM